MPTPPSSATPPPSPEEDEEAGRVEAWLTARPRFLADRPALYGQLHPPHRVHGDRLADHMAAMLTAEREATRSIARAARSGGDLAARVQRAVLALIAAATRTGHAPPGPSTEMGEVIAAEWPALLGLDSVAVAGVGAPSRYLRPLRAEVVGRLLPPGREWRLRSAEPGGKPGGLPAGLPDAEALHGEAAPLILRDAILRLPGNRLLVLGTREAALLPERGAATPLLFLARAAAAALGAPS